MKSYAFCLSRCFPAVAVLFFLMPLARAGGAPVKIGYVGDFSSVSRPLTENAFKFAQYTIAQFNDQGGVLGRPIKMIRRDGANDPERHYRHVVDLVRGENIVAVFGGGSSACVLQASAACRELKIPYLVSIGNAQSIVVDNGHPYVFLFEPNSRMESLGFSIFASLMPWKRYAWFGPDYVWGREVLEFFKQYFETIGSPISWTDEIWHPLGTTDYKEKIRQVIAGQPEALVVATWGKDLQYFLKQAKAYGLFEKMAAFGWFSNIADGTDRILPEGIWKISRGPVDYLSKNIPRPGRWFKTFMSSIRFIPLIFQSAATIPWWPGARPWKWPVPPGRPPWQRP